MDKIRIQEFINDRAEALLFVKLIGGPIIIINLSVRFPSTADKTPETIDDGIYDPIWLW